MSDWKYDYGKHPVTEFEAKLGTSVISIAKECHDCAVDHGFPLHDKLPQLVAFMGEVGEWCEAVRKDDRMNELEEVVDIIVRIFAYAEQHFPDDWLIALKSKMRFNRNRPWLHGGNLF